MGARLINNPRRTNIGHVEDFPVLHMRSLRKSAMFNEGQRTEGHFRYPGASNAITIIVDLRSEHDLEVLLEVGHTDSATNMQVIGLTHRPTGLSGTPTGRTPGSGRRPRFRWSRPRHQSCPTIRRSNAYYFPPGSRTLSEQPT